MDSLPDAIVEYILSHKRNARDVAVCKCVSKRWKNSMPYIKSLYFPRNSFQNYSGGNNPDNIIRTMISNVIKLEELIVYCPFSSSGLASWLSIVGPSLRNLELRMDNHPEPQASHESPSKLDCISFSKNLESLKLWNVQMTRSSMWVGFQKLRNLEIVSTRVEDPTLFAALQGCHNLTNLSLLSCEGVRSVSIELPNLQRCKMDFYGITGIRDRSLSISSPRLEVLEVQGCSWIRVPETKCLSSLSIANYAERVVKVDFGKLVALEFLSMKGICWTRYAVSKMLGWASEVKHLYIRVEFTGDFEELEPFPGIDFVNFFNNHPKLQKFDVHGAMFAALCHSNSLKNVDNKFDIPCLEEVVITVRSPSNVEQKMRTLESFIRYGKNLKLMVIKILQMMTSSRSADDVFKEICKFSLRNRKIVRIE